MKGSLHRKQKNSYVTSGRNLKDLDLLDASSEDKIQSLTLEERTKPFVDAGLASRSPQLDSSSREEMYYPSRSNLMKRLTSITSAVSTRTAR